jgi:hypothetical protein
MAIPEQAGVEQIQERPIVVCPEAKARMRDRALQELPGIPQEMEAEADLQTVALERDQAPAEAETAAFQVGELEVGPVQAEAGTEALQMEAVPARVLAEDRAMKPLETADLAPEVALAEGRILGEPMVLAKGPL